METVKSAHAAQLVCLRDSLAALTSENARLKRSLEETANSKERHALQLQSELAQLHTDNAVLREKLDWLTHKHQ